MALIDSARKAYHLLSELPERALHRFRHRRAKSRQQAAGRPKDVLVLCYGNICRSPYAEARLRKITEERGWDGIRVGSAGFFGPGRRANEAAQRAAESRHLDLSAHKSRLADRDLMAQADLLLVMTVNQAKEAMIQVGSRATAVELLGDFDPEPTPPREIPDPYGRSAADFDRVFDRIDRCLLTLVDTWHR